MAEKNERINNDTNLQNQIDATKGVTSFGFGTIISEIAEFTSGYLLEKDGITFFSFEFILCNISPKVTTTIASITYTPFGICHCSATLFIGANSYSCFASINDGVIQIHLPEGANLLSDKTKNKIRFSGSFPHK